MQHNYTTKPQQIDHKMTMWTFHIVIISSLSFKIRQFLSEINKFPQAKKPDLTENKNSKQTRKRYKVIYKSRSQNILAMDFI